MSSNILSFISALKMACSAGAAFGGLWYLVWVFRNDLQATSPKGIALLDTCLGFVAGGYVCDLMLESDPAKSTSPDSLFYFYS